MKVHRRFGFAATALGAALALSSLAVSQAGAISVVNPTSHHGNATTCADVGLSGSTRFEGKHHSGTYETLLFDYTITHDRYITLTAIDPAVTVHAVVVKGGDHYHVYNPPVASMRSPFNGGDNVPDISHWFLCYGVRPADTTTTTSVEVTTTTVEDTTTTVEDTTTTVEVTTTTVEDTTTTVEDTTTTVVDVEGPTTTLAATTTLVDSDGPTTTLAAAGGPTTTTGTGALPRTGAGADAMLVLGLGLVLGGVVTLLLGRRTVDA